MSLMLAQTMVGGVVVPPPPAPTTSLKTNMHAWYDFESNTNDAHSSNNLITAGSNSVYVAGKQGLARGADGGYIDVTTQVNQTSVRNFSVSGWVRFTSASSYSARKALWFTTQRTTGQTNNFGVLPAGASQYRLVAGGTLFDWPNSDVTEWAHFYIYYSLGTSSTGTLRAYVNGAYVGAETLTNMDSLSFARFYPADSTTSSDTVSQTDSVGFWTRTLTTSTNGEVKQMYANGTGIQYSDIP